MVRVHKRFFRLNLTALRVRYVDYVLSVAITTQYSPRSFIGCVPIWQDSITKWDEKKTKKRKNISLTALHLQQVPCADALPNRAFLVSGAVQRATGVVYYQSIVGLVLLQGYKAPFPYLTMFIHQDQKLRHQSPKCLTYSSNSNNNITCKLSYT